MTGNGSQLTQHPLALLPSPFGSGYTATSLPRAAATCGTMVFPHPPPMMLLQQQHFLRAVEVVGVQEEEKGNPNGNLHLDSAAHRNESGSGGGRSEGLRGLNDNVDVLGEVLCRLDGRSLGVAACVCRLWNGLCRRDAVWERAWRRQVGGVISGDMRERSVVVALGGYRRLYQVCVGPVLGRMQRRRLDLLRLGRSVSRAGGRGRKHQHQQQRQWRWSRDEAQLSLSLFSVDCYERLAGKSSSSLMFLCKAR